MEQREQEIGLYLMDEVFPYAPWKCPRHIWEHKGWDFRDEKCSSIKLVARCVNCGKIAYGVKEYKAVGPNSFDLDDQKLIRSGVLGPNIIERRYREETRKL
jgi:hypothetical protein